MQEGNETNGIQFRLRILILFVGKIPDWLIKQFVSAQN